MSAPAELPVWATAGTNNTDPSAGQKNTGWTTNQYIVSSYLNWWMNLVYQWINYLQNGAGAGWRDKLPNGVLTGMTFASGYYANLFNVAGNIDAVAISPRVGEVITDIRLYCNVAAFAPVMTLTFYKSFNGTATLLGTVTSSGAVGTWAAYSLTLSAAETVADNTSYYFHIDIPTAGGNQLVSSVGYKVTA